MKTQMMRWTKGTWRGAGEPVLDAQLVMVFGSGELLRDESVRAALQALCPQAEMVGCSTAGEILGSNVSDEGAVALALSFRSTTVRTVHREVALMAESYEAGAQLGRALGGDGLRHVLVFSNGLHVNGTQLVAGLRSELPTGVSATGGLAGDDLGLPTPRSFTTERWARPASSP